uniref:Tyr recombinase domain-containing protein n=1 Tax=Strongyloides venezuelensis TaxID=75913 RepID=A0A0K0EXT1_STRVS
MRSEIVSLLKLANIQLTESESRTLNKLLKGIKNTNPQPQPPPKVWNVEQLLKFIQHNLSLSDDLSLRQLTLRTLGLFLLVNPARFAQVGNIKVDEIMIKEDMIIIMPQTKAKNCKGTTGHKLTINTYEDKNLCF